MCFTTTIHLTTSLPTPHPLISSTGAWFDDHAQKHRLEGLRPAAVIPGKWGSTPLATNQLCYWSLPSVTPQLDIQIRGSGTPKPFKDSLFPSQRIILYTKSFRKSKIILFTFSDFCLHKVFSKHAKATECLVGHDMQR